MRCYYIRDGRLIATEELDGLTEQQAIDRGRVLFEKHSDEIDGVEVRNRTRRLCRYGRVRSGYQSKAAPPSANRPRMKSEWRGP